MQNDRHYRPHTRAAKTYLDGARRTRPLNVPIVQSTVYQTASSEELGERFKRRADGVYTRFGHPTTSALADKVASLEGAGAALAFSSGMAAISTSLAAALRPGDHLVAQREIFAQTYKFLDEFMRPFGVTIDYVNATNPEEVAHALRPNTALIYIETPSNPLLRVVDIRAIASMARRASVPLFVDSTFASPVLQNPLAAGASLVLHSGTKFLGGHTDVMCGFAAGDAERIGRIKDHQILFGGVLDPHAAWLVLRGIKTLGVRVEKQARTALHLAQSLEMEIGIRRVHYPWLASSPSHDLARRQMRGGGGVVSFEVEGGLCGARAFVDALETIPIATSLGGVETTIEVPWELDFSDEELGEAASESGVTPGLIRVSVGIEDVEDLAEDLKRGVRALRAVLDPVETPCCRPGPLGTVGPTAVRMY
jgi:cystathionine beta-lyase/cystathionine gamma-synthase